MESAFAVYNKKKKAKKDTRKAQGEPAAKKIKTHSKLNDSTPSPYKSNGKSKHVKFGWKTDLDQKLKAILNSPDTASLTTVTKKSSMKHERSKTRGQDQSLGKKSALQKHNKAIKDNTEKNDVAIPPLIYPHDPKFLIRNNSTGVADKATNLFKWLLNPIKPADFFESYWETGPLHIIRKMPTYYEQVLTTADIDVMLRENPLYFGRNVDIVTYKDGERITENPAGRAKASIVFDAYLDGYSVRILNPQTYNAKVHGILATLQEYFGAMVGANVYLTPPDSQGFAPHFDDIEAFVIQLEGRKHWKLYKPKNGSDNLARFSSKNFSRDDLGEPLSQVTLNAGDILYFPRGIVHEASTDKDMHSLHMTISTYQRTAYVDLLEKILPEALKRAAMKDISYRKGLPVGYLKHLGIINTDVNSPDRKSIIRTVQQLLVNLCNHLEVDSAADQLGRKFIHEALPPIPTSSEQQTTSKYDGDRLCNGNVINRIEVDPDTEVRLLRYHAIRLVIEENEANVYFCTENSKVYHGEEEQFITIEMEMCPIIETLQQLYPTFISVENLPHSDLDKKRDLITQLWDYGIIVTKEPLSIYYEDSDN